MENDKDSVIQLPELETPPAPEAPAASVENLFFDDALPIVTAKLTIAESMLGLLTKNIKFSEFVREILTVIMKVVKSEAGSIIELDYKTNTLFFRAAVGTGSDQVAHFIIPMGQGIVGHVAESKLPLNVSNIEENKIHLKSVAKAIGFEIRNIVAVPIMVKGRVFAVLELLNRVGEENYSTSDVELLGCLCEIAGKAIEIRLNINWALKGEGKAA